MDRIAPLVAPVEDREHLAVLDGFRGLAIVFVVVTHSFLTGYRPTFRLGPFATDFGFETLVYAGSIGVELFFFLSGFVLFLPYARAQLGERAMPTLRHFVDRRFIKIVPSYYLALLCVAFAFFLPADVEARRAIEIVRHAAFVHTYWHESMFAICGAFWSLGVEVQFYVLFPVIALAMRKAPIPTYAALLALGEGYRLWLHATDRHRDFFNVSQLPAQIDLFALGMLCAFAYARFRGRVRGRFAAPAATAIALGAAAAGAFLLRDFAHITKALDIADHQTWQNDHRLVVGFTIAALVMGSLFAVPLWRALVANPVLVWLSTISYNLYLWHEAVMVQCSQTGFPCSGIAQPWRVDSAWGNHYFAGYVLVSIAIATLVTYAFERPLLRLGTRGLLAALFGRLRFPEFRFGQRKKAGSVAGVPTLRGAKSDSEAQVRARRISPR